MDRYVIDAFAEQLDCSKTKRIKDRDRRPLFIGKSAPRGDMAFDLFAYLSSGDLIDFYALTDGNGAYVIFYQSKHLNYWDMYSDTGFIS